MRAFQILGPLLIACLESSVTAAAAVADDDGGLSCGLDDTCTDSDSNASASFKIDSNSSIVDFLDPKVLKPEVIEDIKTSLLSGKLVAINNAFIPEFANYIWERFSRDDVSWKHKQFWHPTGGALIPLEPMHSDPKTNMKLLRQKHKEFTKQTRALPKYSNRTWDPDNNGHNTKKKEARDMSDIEAVFKHKSSKDFMTSISGRSGSGNAVSIPSEYGYGDYSGPHTDFRKLRAVDWVWNLSKDWDPKWGGSFHWGNAKTLEEGYFHPTFNTLILFLPTMESSHWVTPVNKGAKGRRLSINGKVNSNFGDALNIDEPIESAYGKKEDHILLTLDEAFSIVDDLNPEDYTSDPKRHRSLHDLKQSLKENYLNPKDDGTFVVSWEGDEEEDKTNENERDITEEDMTITEESSILDFLDPDILEDTELLSEIGTNLRQGKLVVIQKAFKAGFAEYAWKELNRTIVEWDRVKVDHETDAHFVAKESSHSHELTSVLGIFKNKKTAMFLESLTGRSCGGNEAERNNARPIWYKEGTYSEPRTDFQGSNTVKLHWDLTKNWDDTWGGSFYWFPSKTLNGGYNHPTFNTLMLYLPTPSSTYSITPVAWWTEENNKLFHITASYHSTNEEFVHVYDRQENRIEEVFKKDDDLIRLTSEQAVWIVENADKLTEDPIKMKKLLELKERVSKKYLNPPFDATHRIE